MMTIIIKDVAWQHQKTFLPKQNIYYLNTSCDGHHRPTIDLGFQLIIHYPLPSPSNHSSIINYLNRLEDDSIPLIFYPYSWFVEQNPWHALFTQPEAKVLLTGYRFYLQIFNQPFSRAACNKSLKTSRCYATASTLTKFKLKLSRPHKRAGAKSLQRLSVESTLPAWRSQRIFRYPGRRLL